MSQKSAGTVMSQGETNDKAVTDGASNPFCLGGTSPPPFNGDQIVCLIDGQNLFWGAHDRRMRIDYLSKAGSHPWRRQKSQNIFLRFKI